MFHEKHLKLLFICYCSYDVTELKFAETSVIEILYILTVTYIIYNRIYNHTIILTDYSAIDNNYSFWPQSASISSQW